MDGLYVSHTLDYYKRELLQPLACGLGHDAQTKIVLIGDHSHLVDQTVHISSIDTYYLSHYNIADSNALV